MNWLKRRFNIEGESNGLLFAMGFGFVLVVAFWVSILGSLGFGIFTGDWSYFSTVIGFIAQGVCLAFIATLAMAAMDTISIRGSWKG